MLLRQPLILSLEAAFSRHGERSDIELPIHGRGGVRRLSTRPDAVAAGCRDAG